MEFYVLGSDAKGNDGFEDEASVFVVSDRNEVMEFRNIDEAERWVSDKNIDVSLVDVIIGIKAKISNRVRIEV